MVKTAIFVEGQTEAIFVKALVVAWARANDASVVRERLHAKCYSIVEASIEPTASYFFLIVDCCNDEAVLSSLLDRYSSLVSSGYSHIWGLRDLFPIPSNQLTALQHGVESVLPSGSAQARMFIANREVEAWFLAEDNHFAVINPNLTRQRILSDVNYDVCEGDPESVEHPSDLLKRIYEIVNLTYKKRRNQVIRTVSALDFVKLHCECDQKIPSFVPLRDALDALVCNDQT